MKSCGLSNHLRGLIYIFIVSIFLVSCTATQQATTQYPEILVPKYYILKKPTSADYTHLERLQSSKNPSTAATAGLILGYYYLKDGDLEKASPLIVQNYSAPELSGYMKNMGLLWLMELSLQSGDLAGATAVSEQVRDGEAGAERDEALDLYCTTMRIYPPSDEDNFYCVEERLANVKPVDEPNDIADTPQELLSGVLDILILSRAAPQDASGGVYYYLKQQAISHKIRLSKEYVEGDWDFIIDLDNEFLSGRGGRGISFKPDFVAPIGKFEEIARLQYCSKVLLGVGTNATEAADQLHLSLMEKGVTVGTVRIDDIIAARDVRNFLSEWEKERFCAVGLGNEDDINNFVPTARQYLLMPDKQRVIVMESVDTGKNYTKGYSSYYRSTYIFPLVELTFSEMMLNFAQEYKAFSGRDLTYETVLGYDMMHYIYSQTEEGADDLSPYLTNITSFTDNSTVRALKAFYIDSADNIEQIVFDTEDAR